MPSGRRVGVSGSAWEGLGAFEGVWRLWAPVRSIPVGYIFLDFAGVHCLHVHMQFYLGTLLLGTPLKHVLVNDRA